MSSPSCARAEEDRRVIGRYPEHESGIPLSGYIEDTDLLDRRAAVVEFTVGDVRVVVIGFRAQHRSQPLRTFKLLFNSIYDVGD